jgi:hypothetical protein
MKVGFCDGLQLWEGRLLGANVANLVGINEGSTVGVLEGFDVSNLVEGSIVGILEMVGSHVGF